MNTHPRCIIAHNITRDVWISICQGCNARYEHDRKDVVKAWNGYHVCEADVKGDDRLGPVVGWCA